MLERTVLGSLGPAWLLLPAQQLCASQRRERVVGRTQLCLPRTPVLPTTPSFLERSGPFPGQGKRGHPVSAAAAGGRRQSLDVISTRAACLRLCQRPLAARGRSSFNQGCRPGPALISFYGRLVQMSSKDP